jgi:glycosyltransferase involved in cell wall biosynthesis
LDDRPLVVGIDGRELQGRPTGTGRYLRNLLRRWRETDDSLIVYFSGEPPASARSTLDHPAVACRVVGEGRTSGLVWQQLALPEAARADRLDLFFSPAYACPLALRVPRVTAVHDLSFYSHPQDFTPRDGLRRRLLTGLSVAASRAVLACSDFTRRELVGRFPAAADRVVRVPLGPDDDLPPAPSREEARRRLGLSGPLLVTVGAILNRRCLPELLRSVARLAARHPGLVLDVVGENRTHPRLDLPARVRSLGLGDRVRLSGFVDDEALAERYAAADAAVFLSEYEGFGLPALEAAARGIPLVVGRPPSLGEIFGPAALLVAPRDEAEVARALDRVLVEPGLRERLISAGRDLARRYSWDESAALTRAACLRAARP